MAKIETGPRYVLRDNVNALMAANPECGTMLKLSQKSGVSKGVIERITKAQANTGIDHLEGLAKAFRVHVYQLMIPNLDANNPQTLRALSPAEEALYAKLRNSEKSTQP